MERVAAKSAGASMLVPTATGWQLHVGAEIIGSADSLGKIIASLPPEGRIELLVPTHHLVVERLRLPSTKHEELAGMVRLQWEKVLPFARDELTGDFLVVESGERDAVVLTAALPTATLDQLRQSLGQNAGRIAQVTPSFEPLAKNAPPTGSVLLVAGEDQHLLLVAVNHGQPMWVHVLPAMTEEQFVETLPQILLTAGMEGIETDFSQILLEYESAALAPTLQEFFELPVAIFERRQPSAKSTLNLLPQSWVAETRRRGAQKRMGRWLIVAAILYGVAAVSIFAYLSILKSKSQALDQQLAALQPQLTLLQTRQAQSLALAPAIDPQRYTIEVLYFLHHLLPGDDVRLTEFDHSPQQWRLVGEASSAAQAIEYLNRIKEDPNLRAYTISANPPRLLANGKAQFNIFGKL